MRKTSTWRRGFVFLAAVSLQTFIFSTLSSTLVAAEAAKKVPAFLVKDGKSQGAILLPETYGPAVSLAVDELRTYIKKISGADIPVYYGTPDTNISLARRPRIILEVKAAGNIFDGSDQHFKIKEDGKSVIIHGNSDLALLYGVYQYLDELGVRWFTPGELGEYVPKLADIQVGNRSKDYKPSFRTRALDGCREFAGEKPADFNNDMNRIAQLHRDYDFWTLRNRLQFQRDANHTLDAGAMYHVCGGFNWAREGGGHGITHYALRGADLKKEPERFALVTINGKQERCNDFNRAQICFTDPRNVETAIRCAVEDYDKPAMGYGSLKYHPPVFVATMGLGDCGGICECPNCIKAMGNPSDKQRLLWGFWNKVAAGIRAQRPQMKIGVFAPYGDVGAPPADMKLEPNILAMACRLHNWDNAEHDKATYPFTKKFKETIDAIRAAGAEQGVYDYILVGGTPQPLNVFDAAKAYHERGVQVYTPEVMGRDEQRWIVLWVLAQYTWDSSRDPWALLKEYCQKYYGAAGEDVHKCLLRLDEQSRKTRAIFLGPLENAFEDGMYTLTPEFVREGQELLAAAEKKVEGREKERVHLFRETFDMLSMAADVYRYYQAALNARNEKATSELKKKYDDFEKIWKERELFMTCSPDILHRLKNLTKVNTLAVPSPKGREELKDKKVWLDELFAGDAVPKDIPNLYPLPEVWKFRLDPQDNGMKEGWQQVDYKEDGNWQAISTWNWFEGQGYPHIEGCFWYRTDFTAPLFPEGKKVFLRIGSLDDDGDVYVNGNLVLSRKMMNGNEWETSFAVDVSSSIKPGQRNVIALRGYDRTGGGGIWRPCALYTE